MMNWNQLETQWPQLSAQAKHQWLKLTEDDLKVIAGKKGTLIRTLQSRYGVFQGDAEKQVNDWFARLAPQSDPREAVPIAQEAEHNGLAPVARRDAQHTRSAPSTAPLTMEGNDLPTAPSTQAANGNGNGNGTANGNGTHAAPPARNGNGNGNGNGKHAGPPPVPAAKSKDGKAAAQATVISDNAKTNRYVVGDQSAAGQGPPPLPEAGAKAKAKVRHA